MDNIPVLTSLRGYQKSWFTRDMVAGLTLWAVLVPEALAYATIAGVSPVIGLYAVPPALLLYAAFGSSKHLIVGPGAATAALSAAAVAELTTGGPDNFLAFTAMLALVTGVLALVAGLLRLGFVANLIAEPVMKGFIIGLSLTIIAGQLPKVFGFEKEEGNFFQQLWDFLGHLDETQWRSLTVGALSFVIVVGLRRFAPSVPASLVAVAFGIVVVHVFDLAQHGVAIVGHIDSGLPSIGLPDELDLNDYLAATASAVGVMLVGFAEGLAAAKTYITPNQTGGEMSTRKSSCNCGQLSLTYDGPDPARISLCQCYECQRRTGSVFSMQARLPVEHVTVEGRSTTWTFPSDSGKPATFRSCDSAGATYRFCPECGSTVYWDISVAPEVLGVAVGGFADTTFPPPMTSGFEAYGAAWAMNASDLPMPGDTMTTTEHRTAGNGCDFDGTFPGR